MNVFRLNMYMKILTMGYKNNVSDCLFSISIVFKYYLNWEKTIELLYLEQLMETSVEQNYLVLL